LCPNPSQVQQNVRTQQAIKKSTTVDHVAYFKDQMSYQILGQISTLGRNVFQSISGYFGIGPAGRNDINASAVQPGDCIAVMPNAQYPVILRPVEDGIYVLVGKDYIACPEGPPWSKEGNILLVVPIRIR
jgi:hypothetical protein